MDQNYTHRALSVGFIRLEPENDPVGIALVSADLGKVLATLLAKAWAGIDLSYQVFFGHAYIPEDDVWVLAMDVHYSEGTAFTLAFNDVGDTDWTPVLAVLLSQKVLLVWDRRAVVGLSELPRAELLATASVALEGGVREALLEHLTDMRREADFLNTVLKALD